MRTNCKHPKLIVYNKNSDYVKYVFYILSIFIFYGMIVDSYFGKRFIFASVSKYFTSFDKKLVYRFPNENPSENIYDFRPYRVVEKLIEKQHSDKPHDAYNGKYDGYYKIAF